MTPGMGMGGAFGTVLDHFETILKIVGHFQNNYMTILGPPMPNNYVFQPKTNFLEMAHTNFVSSIR